MSTDRLRSETVSVISRWNRYYRDDSAPVVQDGEHRDESGATAHSRSQRFAVCLIHSNRPDAVHAVAIRVRVLVHEFNDCVRDVHPTGDTAGQ
jgi:hypothetical protein